MGSGHFLVSLVAYLADEVLTAITEAPTLVAWANPEQPYRSPLAARIERLRAEIQRSANENGWPVPDEQLDRHLVRRIILKRVIYGVDLNPMAVELAKTFLVAALVYGRRAVIVPRSSFALRRLTVRRIRRSNRAGIARTLWSGVQPRRGPGAPGGSGNGARRGARRRGYRRCA